MKRGFSMLELLVVIILIGILSTLAYVNFMDLVKTNRAKEVARDMTAFIERAIAEGKTRQKPVEISISGNTITANGDGIAITRTLVNGYSPGTGPGPNNCDVYYGNTVTSNLRIGISGAPAGCFVMCNGNYCGAAVKTNEKNTFTAHIRKGSPTWEAL